MKPILLFIIGLLLIYCNGPKANNIKKAHPLADSSIMVVKITGHIKPPDGFERIKANQNSFTTFLRNIPLKKNNMVYLFNGEPKRNQQAQYAVLDIPVGNKDLQQCADAVMRLRAEYLFAQKRYDEIIFYDNNKKPFAFTAPYTKEHLEKYLPLVFANCGTASLAKQLKPANGFNSIEPGDILIKGGSPGHAVIVMDVVINSDGKKAFMLAQSYMPAQDIHILNNPQYNSNYPWYSIDKEKTITTPEWEFNTAQLMKW
jgi:Domain of unknown function (4846)